MTAGYIVNIDNRALSAMDFNQGNGLCAHFTVEPMRRFQSIANHNAECSNPTVPKVVDKGCIKLLGHAATAGFERDRYTE
jgi:hypothetical protein